MTIQSRWIYRADRFKISTKTTMKLIKTTNIVTLQLFSWNLFSESILKRWLMKMDMRIVSKVIINNNFQAETQSKSSLLSSFFIFNSFFFVLKFSLFGFWNFTFSFQNPKFFVILIWNFLLLFLEFSLFASWVCSWIPYSHPSVFSSVLPRRLLISLRVIRIILSLLPVHLRHLRRSNELLWRYWANDLVN